MHCSLKHGISTLNDSVLGWVSSKINNESQLPARATYLSPSSSNKQSAPIDFSLASPLKKRLRVKKGSCCFRCGFSGHIPTDCRAEKTVTGRAAVTMVPDKVPANSVIPAGTSICAPSAAREDMVRAPVNMVSDPHGVTTPLRADAVEEMLRTYNLWDDWQHIVYGIRFGFDVDVGPPPMTHIFRKSCIIQPEPRIYIAVHTQGASNWPLLTGLFPLQIRAPNWSVQDISTRAGSQIHTGQPSNDTGHGLSSE
ncbi:hypothetical protein M422DRAFT_240055 [Sphaerobolus stellatus SS14]|nr:hypothetical protein M422DRAFT_240055 [Sphaerobolus stellatus SS14]